MFIAKISKGRTIKEFINGTLSAPVLYSFMWLVVFGGQVFNYLTRGG
jgi:choline-glycine betaine transporter